MANQSSWDGNFEISTWKSRCSANRLVTANLRANFFFFSFAPSEHQSESARISIISSTGRMIHATTGTRAGKVAGKATRFGGLARSGTRKHVDLSTRASSKDLDAGVVVSPPPPPP